MDALALHDVVLAAGAAASPVEGLSLLFPILQRLDASEVGVITPAHALFAKLCFFSKIAAAGGQGEGLTKEALLAFLDLPRYQVSAGTGAAGKKQSTSSSSSSASSSSTEGSSASLPATAADVLAFFFFSGCFYASARQWAKAVEAFETVRQRRLLNISSFFSCIPRLTSSPLSCDLSSSSSLSSHCSALFCRRQPLRPCSLKPTRSCS